MSLENLVDQAAKNLDARQKKFLNESPKKLDESTKRFKKKIDNAKCPCGEIHRG
jgi:hypothetical protein